MKLFEHPDFDQFVLAAAEHFTDRGLRPAIIEKDYYVTEALRIIATAAGGKIIFKGGTSLSKGWNLIERFSEDIDIFLDPLAFDPPLGKNEALNGLPAFAAEQVTAMSLDKKKGLDVDGLWERKRQQIDETPGLRVFRKKITLDDIGGVLSIKSFISRLMHGKARPNARFFGASTHFRKRASALQYRERYGSWTSRTAACSKFRRSGLTISPKFNSVVMRESFEVIDDPLNPVSNCSS